MKKLLILLLVSCGGYSLFGSTPSGSELIHLINPCLLGHTDTTALEKYKKDNPDIVINFETIKMGHDTLAKFFEGINPRLFPQKIAILNILAAEPALKEYHNETGKDDGEQVADYIKDYISNPDIDIVAEKARYVFKTYPIRLEDYKFDETHSLSEAFHHLKPSPLKLELVHLIKEEDTRRELRERVIACFLGVDKEASNKLDEFIKTAGLKEGEFLLDVWEKEGSPHAAFAKEFKDFIRSSGASLPHGQDVIKRLSADQVLLEPNVSEDWFLSGHENWFNNAEREALSKASMTFVDNLKKDSDSQKKKESIKDPATKNPERDKDKSSLLKKVAIFGAVSVTGYVLYRFATKSRSDAESQIS